MKSDLLSDSMDDLLGFVARSLGKLTDCDLDCTMENLDIWAILLIILFTVVGFCCPKNLLFSSWIWRKFKKDDKTT